MKEGDREGDVTVTSKEKLDRFRNIFTQEHENEVWNTACSQTLYRSV